MDPFSLTTGITTTLGACTAAESTFAKLRRLKNVPVLIQALNNEVSDHDLIMLDASECLEPMKRKAGQSDRVDKALIDLCLSTLA